MLTASNTAAGLDTYLRQSQLLRERIVPFSAPTLWRHVKAGIFPQPVKIGPGVTAWRLRDIQAWQLAQGKRDTVVVE